MFEILIISLKENLEIRKNDFYIVSYQLLNPTPDIYLICLDWTTLLPHILFSRICEKKKHYIKTNIFFASHRIPLYSKFPLFPYVRFYL